MTSASLKFVALALCLVFSFAVNAQQKQEQALSKRELRQRLYPELMRTFDLAEAAPASLRALALLRIASFPANKDEEWKRELLEEAFEAASQSPLRWRVTAVSLPDGKWDGHLPQRFIQETEISNSGLDRLFLQTSVVQAMLIVDKGESLRLFSRISPLRLPTLACSDGLVPNVEDYYRTAGRLARDAFTPTQRKKKEYLEFLRSLLQSVGSPVEVGPAAQMVWGEHLPSSEAGVLAAALGQQLATLPADCRSFFSWLGDTSESVTRLADSLESGDAAAFLKAWRTYLVHNLSGARCSETVDPKWAYVREASAAVSTFNLRAEKHEAVTLIEKDDIRPEKVDPPLAEGSPSIPEQDNEFHLKWEWLMFGDQHRGLTDEQKNTAEWRTRFDEYLSAIENLEPSGDQNDVDLLQKKCDLMRDAVLVAPSGPEREHTLARYTALLKISNIPPERVPQWYFAVHSLIDLTRSMHQDRESALRSLEATGDPLLGLVAAIHRLDASYQKPASSSAK